MKYGEPALSLYGGDRYVMPYEIDEGGRTPGQLLEQVAREQGQCPYTKQKLHRGSVVVFGYLQADDVDEGCTEHYEVEACSQTAWGLGVHEDLVAQVLANEVFALVYVREYAGSVMRCTVRADGTESYTQLPLG